jgi:purine-binding chemotaxis protein CheW
MDHPLVVFNVVGVQLAVRAADVTAISAVENHAPLPGAPSHIVGLVATGERVVALVDLAAFFDLPDDDDPADDPMFHRTLYVKAGDYEAGLLCNRANGLVAVDESRLRDPTVLQGSRLRPYLASELDTDDAVVGVIDLPALLQAAAVP